jgi:intracellular septation protein
MKLLFEFLPILLFFVTYKLYGVYMATAVGMLASLIQLSIYWFKYRKLEGSMVITFLLILILGGLTLFFHNDMFIKWKPTAIYWIFAAILLGSQFMSKKPLFQRLFESKLSLPLPVWKRLNLSWALFFTVLGLVNLYVIYNFSTNFWVDFKLFGCLGLFIIFIIVQSIYLSRYLEDKDKPSDEKSSKKVML